MRDPTKPPNIVWIGLAEIHCLFACMPENSNRASVMEMVNDIWLETAESEEIFVDLT